MKIIYKYLKIYIKILEYFILKFIIVKEVLNPNLLVSVVAMHGMY